MWFRYPSDIRGVIQSSRDEAPKWSSGGKKPSLLYTRMRRRLFRDGIATQNAAQECSTGEGTDQIMDAEMGEELH